MADKTEDLESELWNEMTTTLNLWSEKHDGFKGDTIVEVLLALLLAVIAGAPAEMQAKLCGYCSESLKYKKVGHLLAKANKRKLH